MRHWARGSDLWQQTYGNSMVMLATARDEELGPVQSLVRVGVVDEHHAKAVAAGAHVAVAPRDFAFGGWPPACRHATEAGNRRQVGAKLRVRSRSEATAGPEQNRSVPLARRSHKMHKMPPARRATLGRTILGSTSSRRGSGFRECGRGARAPVLSYTAVLRGDGFAGCQGVLEGAGVAAHAAVGKPLAVAGDVGAFDLQPVGPAPA